MKQKLVDVDKIKSKYNDNWPSEIAEGFQIAIDAIEDAPIADAVPIEWIKKFNSIKCSETVEEMLKDWRKENADVC